MTDAANMARSGPERGAGGAATPALGMTAESLVDVRFRPRADAGPRLDQAEPRSCFGLNEVSDPITERTGRRNVGETDG